MRPDKLRSPWFLVGLSAVIVGAVLSWVATDRDQAALGVGGLLLLGAGIAAAARGDYLWRRRQYTRSEDND